MSNFYINYLRKNRVKLPDYVKEELREKSKHRSYIVGTYSNGTEKHSKLLSHLRANSECALKNYMRK